ncbi:NADH:ubiquinone reductase (Na(+)-transporting) subunit C [Brumimicrobium aurantiacum]|uniref:Na(+)-translocating NADH-quinone reductase subunit C n=1 Tax=Brumimicrobium aurantiacum TaxID=1737063 RepID=A0A3E1EVA7_9FLAO|nr:NADH:ubiquinone reductase (Na(+)-transporting) subunit C [Brumimicrobium aurantiacum]RFC53452.1 NADH:ubiquinone reductase (Na(+)-transporting) subunit C [Brumimicrobium aurantiacum]
MKVNKDGNGYTFAFSIILVIVVGVILSSLSIGLKPLKKANVEVKKKMSILSALGVESTRKDGSDKYEKYIKDSYVISHNGVLQENLPEEKQAFSLDVQKQFRDKTIKVEDRLYPIFEAEKDGTTLFVLPVVGKGLWGPIWGFVALADDYETIVGTSFDHKGETPGLGAEIAQSFFEDRYIDEKIAINGSFTPISVVQNGSGFEDQKVDGITGGTITSKGVEKMVNETMEVYYKYFSKNK